jgi:hypothetical protein
MPTVVATAQRLYRAFSTELCDSTLTRLLLYHHCHRGTGTATSDKVCHALHGGMPQLKVT